MKYISKDGKFSIHLNDELIRQQKLNEEDVGNIVELHYKRTKLFNKARTLNPINDNFKLRFLGEYLKYLEYCLQQKWKFPLDEDYHSYWYVIPHCTCPKIDNKDVWGTGIKYINSECPIHGDKKI